MKVMTVLVTFRISWKFDMGGRVIVKSALENYTVKM